MSAKITSTRKEVGYRTRMAWWWTESWVTAMYSTYGGESALSTSRLTIVELEHIGSMNLETTLGKHLAHEHICCAVSKFCSSFESESQTYLILCNTLENSRGFLRPHRFGETRSGFGDGEGTLEYACAPALLESTGQLGVVVEFVGEEWAGCVQEVLVSVKSADLLMGSWNSTQRNQSFFQHRIDQSSAGLGVEWHNGKAVLFPPPALDGG
jgi:hypothetical protein